MTLGPPHAPYLPDAIRLRLDVTELTPGVFCWIWQGARNPGGYGHTSQRDRMVTVHRLTYAAARGPVPPGMSLDHACHVPATCPTGPCEHRACANPWHLLPATHAQNMAPGRVRRAAPRFSSGVCGAGLHDVTEPGSVYVYPDGERECLRCKREARARWSAARP